MLATKLALPISRSNLVLRPRLAQRLNGAIDHDQKLILISASAGYGKTTLLVEWLSTLQLLMDGRSIQEIAAGLVISVHTARTHVKHIYAKLDVHNRVQALERARVDLLI